MNEQQALIWLSEQRYERFLVNADGDHDAAIALYEWHAQLSSACFKLIHHFEVLVRNAVDGVLGVDQPQVPIHDTWLLDFGVLHPNGVKRVIAAIERLEKGKDLTRGRVVAALPFAFWASLFSRHYEELWRHHLRLVFPAGHSLMRKDLSARMKLLQRFRNRVAHHDSLLSQDVSSRLEDMLTIAGWIDPAARIWLRERNEAFDVVRSGPPMWAAISSAPA